MFTQPFWAWFWLVMFLLGIVGVFRAYRRGDRATLRQSIIGATGALCLALAHWVLLASAALTGIGYVCLVASAIDGLFFGSGRPA